MTTLTDTQRILLTTASQRESNSLHPLPSSITATGGTTKSIASMVKRGLIEERETSVASAVVRTDGDLRYGLFATPAGLQAIGVGLDAERADAADRTTPPSAPPAPPQRPTKSAAVLALLCRPEGATLPVLIEATGWLPHTVRAALTGLRKKSHTLEKSKRGDVTCYKATAA